MIIGESSVQNTILDRFRLCTNDVIDYNKNSHILNIFGEKNKNVDCNLSISFQQLFRENKLH
jgi:hypothetical protein